MRGLICAGPAGGNKIMDKIKTITKALFIGMGIYFLFKVSAYSFYVFIPCLLSLAIVCIVSYFFVFKSENIFNLFFKNFPNEKTTVEFQIKCLNIFILFYAILSLSTSLSYFIIDIQVLLHIPRSIIDSIVYREWLLVNKYPLERSLNALVKLLFVLFNLYLVFGTQHFIKLLINSEKKQNVQL